MVFPRLRQDQYLSICLMCIMLLLGGIKSPVTLADIVASEQSVAVVKAAPVPIRSIPINSAAANPAISAPAALVIDLPSASILFDLNAHHYYHPASTAKLMTALIARRTYAPDSTFTVDEEAYTAGTTLGLTPGMKLTTENTLQALLIHSANDAAFLLANNYPGGYTSFVQAMNDQARQLHLDQTSYTNPSGLDEPNQVTTPFDLGILTKEILKDEFLAVTVASSSAVIKDQQSQEKFQIYSTNRLLTQDSRYRGVKTGTTDLAGEVLVSRFIDGERDIVVVVMASQDRYQDTQTLVNWALTHYQWQSVE